MAVTTFKPVLEQFPKDDQYWRIDWLGDVSFQRHIRYNQPFIRVVLSKVNLDADGDWSFSVPCLENLTQTERSLPIATLGMLGIGSIWKNGELFLEPDYISECINLNISNDNSSLIKAGVDYNEKGFILPFDLHPYHRYHTHSYCIHASNPDGKSILVPALELFRFYFGTSSSLIYKLFHAPFESSKLWSSAKIDETGIADINLAIGISGYSAPEVARIAFDPQAQYAAKLFTNSILNSRSPDDKVYPKMVFPFFGNTNLHVRGVWLENIFLVFRIISCSHYFPFHSLRYTMQKKKITINDKNKSPGEKDSDQLMNGGKKDPKDSSLKNSAPDKNLATKKKLFKSEKRFPDLESKHVVRVDPETPARILYNSSSQTEGLSICEGENKSGVRSIDLVELSELKSLKGHVLEGTAFARYVEKYIEELIRLGGKVKFVPVNERQMHPQFSLMPEFIDEYGVISPISLIERNEKTSSRYMCVIINENSDIKKVHLIIEGENEIQPGHQVIIDFKDNEFINLVWIGNVIRKTILKSN